MTTILKCSIFSILKLEKFKLHPFDKKICKNEVQLCLKKQEFTIHPGIKLQQQIRKSRSKRKFSVLFYALLAFAILLLSFIVKLSFPYPLHASCLLKWEFGEPCAFVIQRLRSQIVKWSNYRYCGVKCLYKMNELVSYENNTIKAIHISPNSNIVDEIDIIFAASSNNSCIALAESSSKNWYMLFDNGRNYCNLHNLVTGATYDVNNNFLEFTNNIICTQYEMAYCD